MMTRYIDTALSAGEPVLYDAKVHWAIFIQPFTSLWWFALIGTFIYFSVGDMAAKFFELFATTNGLQSWIEFVTPKTIAIGVLCVIFGFSFIHSVIYYFNSDFVLTDRRVISKFGLLSRTTSEQRLSKVESIQVHQSFLGRLLNFGTVTIIGTGSSDTTFGPMANPIACKRAIEAQLDLINPARAEA